MAEQTKEVAPAQAGKQIQQPAAARALSPFEEMDRMMDRLFENFFPRNFMRPFRFDWPEMMATQEMRVPRVDVIDRDEDVLVRAELPGVQKKDLDVSIRDSSVSIRAAIESEEKEEKGEYYRHELSRGTFMRTVALPTDIDGEKAKASFKDGILELTLPKREQARARRLNIE